jgi:diguanylate cyclase (GGDEF)-like protein
MDNRRRGNANRDLQIRLATVAAAGIAILLAAVNAVPATAYEAFNPELGVLTFVFVAVRQVSGAWAVTVPALLYAGLAMAIRVLFVNDSVSEAAAVVVAHLFSATTASVIFVVLSRRYETQVGGFMISLIPAAVIAGALPVLVFPWWPTHPELTTDTVFGVTATWAIAGMLGVLLFAPVGLLLLNPWAAKTESRNKRPVIHGSVTLAVSALFAFLVGEHFDLYGWISWILLIPLIYGTLLAGPRWVSGAIALIAITFAFEAQHSIFIANDVWIGVLGSQVALITVGVMLPFASLAVNAQLLSAQHAHAALILAKRDALTGVWNRHALDSVLEKQQERAIAARTLAGIIYIDIDQFKPLNDQYGHAAGDEVLRDVGARLRATVRDTDDVVRMGGDEFLVALSGLRSEDDLRVVVKAIHAAMTVPFRVSYQQSTDVTASLGYALRQPGEPAASCVARADQDLYRHKAQRANLRV